MRKLFYILIPSCLIVTVCAFVFYPVSNFPQPKGPYGVGQIKYHWVDVSRQDQNTQDPEHPNRELMVYVYYPSSLRYDETGPSNKSDARTPYDSDATESTIDFLSNTCKLPRFVFSGIKFIKTYSQPDAPIASAFVTSTPLLRSESFGAQARLRRTSKTTSDKQSPIHFPVIIFSHGGGVVVQQYTYMLEELASHGFIVVGINHPYTAATVRYPDGHIVKSMYREKAHDAKGKAELLESNAQDVSIVLNKIEELHAAQDEFWSHADLSKIGVMGHSFGGRTATKVIRQDPRFKCGINMEGGAQNEDIAEPFSKPFMFMIAEKSFLYNKNFPAYATETKPFLDSIHHLAETKNSNTKVLTIKDVGHSGFIDTPLQLNTTLLMRFVSRIKPDLLNAPAGMASDVLINKVMPSIISFFEEKLNCATDNRKNEALRNE